MQNHHLFTAAPFSASVAAAYASRSYWAVAGVMLPVPVPGRNRHCACLQCPQLTGQACHEEASACNTLTVRFSSARVGLMEGGCCGGGVAMAPASLTAIKLLVAAGEAEGLARPLLIWRDARRSDLERPCSTPCMSAKPSGNAAIAAGCRLLLGDGRGGKLRGPSVSLVPGDL